MSYLLCFLLMTGTSLTTQEVNPPNSSHVKTYAASSLLPIHEEIKISNEGTLVLLDIGGTLLHQRDPILHRDHEHWKKAWFERCYPQLSPEEKKELARVVEGFLIKNDCGWQRLDKWPELVKQAQMQKIKVIAFSKVLTDPALQHALAIRLANFGIPIHDDLPELAGEKDQFIYAGGVIQTSEKLKGPVLKEAISKMTHSPHKIIFVDDRKEQVESVHLACQELGIPAVCFHYMGPSEPPALDEAIANYQLNVLVKEHRWVPSEEASKILESRTIKIGNGAND